MPGFCKYLGLAVASLLSDCFLRRKRHKDKWRVGRMISSTYSPSLNLQLLFLNSDVATVEACPWFWLIDDEVKGMNGIVI